MTSAEPVLVAVDAPLLQRVLAESGVERSLAGADLKAWLAHLAGEAAARVAAFFGLGVDAVAGRWVVWKGVGLALVLLAAAAVVWRLGQWLRAGRRRRAGPEGGEGVAEPFALQGMAAPADWRRELERRLAAGRLPEALAAAWWWLATSLAAGGRVDPAWTSRELLDRAAAAAPRRRHLVPLLARFDHLAYGPRAATPEEVRELVAGMEAALA